MKQKKMGKAERIKFNHWPDEHTLAPFDLAVGGWRLMEA
jgi:hypothetical protein